MLPDIVTFWHGPMDALRQTCLRSQLAAGHKVTVYSFDTIPGLPAGVENAEAEAILPHAFSERLRPPQPDGSWRDWTTLQFSDFFRMKLMAKGAGLWLDADVLLLKPAEIDPAKPYFAWERPRQLGNSVIYLPPQHGIVTAFEELMEQEELTPNWLSLRHRITFAMRRLRGGSNRLSDIRVAIFGPAALTALARRTGELHNALPKQIVLRRACRAKTVLRSLELSRPRHQPRDHRPPHLAQGPRRREADPGQSVCVGSGAIWVTAAQQVRSLSRLRERVGRGCLHNGTIPERRKPSPRALRRAPLPQAGEVQRRPRRHYRYLIQRNALLHHCA